MKRLLTVLLTAFLVLTSTLTTRVVFADEEDGNTEVKTQDVLDDVPIEDDDSLEDKNSQENQDNLTDESDSEDSVQTAVDGNSSDNTKEDGTISEETTIEVTNEQQEIDPLNGTAYAVLVNDSDLVFFRSFDSYESNPENTDQLVKDICGNTYVGMVYTGIESLIVDPSKTSPWLDIPWYPQRESVNNVYVAPDQKIRPASTSYWFYYCDIISFNADGFDTSFVTDMSSMFEGCSFGRFAPATIDLRRLDTSNVTNMNSMFKNARPNIINEFDLSGFNTSNVTDMGYMFYSFHTNGRASILDLRSFNTHIVTNMQSMFASCGSNYIDLSSFDTSSVTNMRNMFSNVDASSMDVLDLSHFNTSKVKDMSGMFAGGLYSALDISGFDTSNVTDMTYMFNGSNLSELDLSNFDTSNVTSMTSMFYNTDLESLDLSNFDTHKVAYMSSMFMFSDKLVSIIFYDFDTTNVTSMYQMFKDCSKLESLDLSSFSTINITNLNEMFSGCTNLKSIDLRNFNTSNEYYMSPIGWCKVGMRQMFHKCDSLSSVTLGQEWTEWCDEAYLPVGTWYHNDLAKTETELYYEYPTHAASWAGTWSLTPPPIKVPEGKYGIHVVDNQGIALKNAMVSWEASSDNVMTEYTDNQGNVFFDISTINEPTIRVSLDGYMTWSNENSDWKKSSNHFDTIVLYPESFGPLMLASASYWEVLPETHDILSGTAKVTLLSDAFVDFNPNGGKFYVKCRAYRPDLVEKYELYHFGYLKKTSTVK